MAIKIANQNSFTERGIEKQDIKKEISDRKLITYLTPTDYETFSTKCKREGINTSAKVRMLIIQDINK